jgi:hypothetical protein
VINPPSRFTWSQPGQAGTKKGWLVREIPNYKFQITTLYEVASLRSTRRIPNPKSQITKQKKVKKNVCKHPILNSLQTCQKISCQKMAKLCDQVTTQGLIFHISLFLMPVFIATIIMCRRGESE